jgi:hypothetical protein
MGNRKKQDGDCRVEVQETNFAVKKVVRSEAQRKEKVESMKKKNKMAAVSTQEDNCAEASGK